MQSRKSITKVHKKLEENIVISQQKCSVLYTVYTILVITTQNDALKRNSAYIRNTMLTLTVLVDGKNL